MAPNDTLPEERDDVVAAARAAASWARARRATWTSAPLPSTAAKKRKRRAQAEAPPVAPPPLEEILREHLPQQPPPPPLPPPPAPVAASAPAPVKDTGPSMAARAAEAARAIGAPLLQWGPRLAAVAAIGWGLWVGAPYLWSKIPARSTAPARSETPPPAPAAASKAAAPAAATRRRATGGLEVKSTPPGAQVLVDGKARGATPLTLADLPAGKHAIELRSDAGTVQRTITIAAGETAQVEESIFSGWLAVRAPFDVVISEGSRALTLDDRSQVMLPPGRHQIRVVNRALAYDVVHTVDLKPGEGTNLTITPAPSSLTLTSSEPVAVWLDGERIGETPLNAAPVQIGTHDLLVRRAAGGERKLTVTVTANPFTLHIDFTRP